MVGHHIEKDTGCDRPSGIRMSWQAIASIIALLALIGTGFAALSRLQAVPISQAIQHNTNAIQRLTEVQAKQLEVNALLIEQQTIIRESLARIEGGLGVRGLRPGRAPLEEEP